jgi:hypothetical protein
LGSSSSSAFLQTFDSHNLNSALSIKSPKGNASLKPYISLAKHCSNAKDKLSPASQKSTIREKKINQNTFGVPLSANNVNSTSAGTLLKKNLSLVNLKPPLTATSSCGGNNGSNSVKNSSTMILKKIRLSKKGNDNSQ